MSVIIAHQQLKSHSSSICDQCTRSATPSSPSPLIIITTSRHHDNRFKKKREQNNINNIITLSTLSHFHRVSFSHITLSLSLIMGQGFCFHRSSLLLFISAFVILIIDCKGDCGFPVIPAGLQTSDTILHVSQAEGAILTANCTSGLRPVSYTLTCEQNEWVISSQPAGIPYRPCRMLTYCFVFVCQTKSNFLIYFHHWSSSLIRSGGGSRRQVPLHGPEWPFFHQSTSDV